jgi:hypothetical protein
VKEGVREREKNRRREGERESGRLAFFFFASFIFFYLEGWGKSSLHGR